MRKLFISLLCLAVGTITSYSREATAPSGTKQVRATSIFNVIGYKPQGYIDVGMLAGAGMVGPAANLNLGVRLHDIAYLSLETGYSFLFLYDSPSTNGWVVPLGVNMRGYIPILANIYPFISLTLGCAFSDTENTDFHRLSGGNTAVFHCQALCGCDFRHLSVGVGWDRFHDTDAFVIKVGILIGK